MTYIIPFTRRWNRDSSIDSICTKCFRTIASSNSEDELADRENKHVCHPNGECIRADAAFSPSHVSFGPRQIYEIRGPHLIQREFPRLCRGGSSSLTFAGGRVAPGNHTPRLSQNRA